MNDWHRALLAMITAAFVSWGGWASFTIALQSKDIAFLQGTIKQIEKRLENK